MTATTTPRFVFIDFDGTYADHGVVPPAHAEAVRQASANGHKVFLCTGRPKSMVPPTVLDGVFDGLVGAAGGYVELDGEVLADVRFPAELGERLVRLLDQHHVVYVLEAAEAAYTRAASVDRLAEILQATLKTEAGPRDILDNVVPLEAVTDQTFAKVTCFASSTPLREVLDELGAPIGLIPSSLPDLGDGAGELYLPEINKWVGIDVVQQRYGVPTSDVIAIGDGWNDLEMITHAGTGVVVEGAPPELLAHADLVIKPPTEDGLVAAFAQLGLT